MANEKLKDLDKKMVLLKIKKKSLDTLKEIKSLKKERAKEVRSQSNGK